MARKISVMFLSAILIFILGGCQMIRIEEGEVSPVEYTIVSQEDIPAEALSLIQEKREKEFQLTYQSGEDLYLINQRLWKADDGRVQYRSRRAGNDGKGPAF